LVVGRVPSTADVAAPYAPVCLGTKAPLQLHQAPDLAAVDPEVRLDVGRCPLDGGEIDAEQLDAPLQRRGDRPRVSRGRAAVGLVGVRQALLPS
jgi:hypothetical protein